MARWRVQGWARSLCCGPGLKGCFDLPLGKIPGWVPGRGLATIQKKFKRDVGEVIIQTTKVSFKIIHQATSFSFPFA